MATLLRSRRRAMKSKKRFLRDPLFVAARNSMERRRQELDDFYRRIGDLEERQIEWAKYLARQTGACVPPVYAYAAPLAVEALAMRDICNWGRDQFSDATRP